MVQVQGAVAPTLLFFLLLVALQVQDVRAAPWQGRGLGRGQQGPAPSPGSTWG